MSPPVPVALAVESDPEIATDPPAPPPIWMLPSWPPIDWALMLPEMFTALRAAVTAVAASRITVEPGATIWPVFDTSGLAPPPAVGTATCRKPSPETSSVACSPEPSATWPSGTAISPALLTWPPSSAA